MTSLRDLAIWVGGIPVTEGSTRTVTTRSGKPVIIHDRARELAQWRLRVRHEAEKAARAAGWEAPVDVPVTVSAVFFLPRPKRPRFDVPAVRPDLDKLGRAVGDALAPGRGLGVLTDDARITWWHMAKRYTESAGDKGVGVAIVVTALKEES